MHIYAFGSVCRGDVSPSSDIDLLAITDGLDPRFDPDSYSIYSYKRISELWQEGNPFAWHLALESKLLFASDKNDYLKSLGDPAPYRNCVSDCEKFYALFRDARTSLASNHASRIFDLSTIFLSVRNIASCFSLGVTTTPTFARNSASRLEAFSIKVSSSAYQVLESARILCTRGHGNNILTSEVDTAILELDEIDKWMDSLVKGAKAHERI
jgi:hypothetical protein